MRLLLVCLCVCSLSANADLIKWTSADACFDPGQVICGSFFFNTTTNEVSFIDLTLTINDSWYGQDARSYPDLIRANRYELWMVNLPSPGVICPFCTPDLRLTGFDLALPERQGFNWTADYFIDTLSGSSDLIPSYEALPVPAAATLPLVAVAFLALGWSRRRV